MNNLSIAAILFSEQFQTISVTTLVTLAHKCTPIAAIPFSEQFQTVSVTRHWSKSPVSALSIVVNVVVFTDGDIYHAVIAALARHLCRVWRSHGCSKAGMYTVPNVCPV